MFRTLFNDEGMFGIITTISSSNITLFMIFGAFLGGLFATRYGMGRSMVIGAVLTIITNLAFAWLATVTVPRAAFLFVTIGADNIAAGFAGGVFIAFMSILTNKAMSATQYALYSSLFAFFGKSLAGFSGLLADAVDYEMFFILTGLFGIPALILSIWTWLNGFTDGIDERATPANGPFVLSDRAPTLEATAK